MTDRPQLTNDARNRALRVFLQGLAFTVLAAVLMVLYPLVTSADGWEDFDWSQIGFALVQAVSMSAMAFVMRRYLDPSGFPTPLPPEDPGPPADDAPAPGPVELGAVDVALLLLVAILVSVLLLLFGVHFRG